MTPLHILQVRLNHAMSVMWIWNRDIDAGRLHCRWNRWAIWQHEHIGRPW